MKIELPDGYLIRSWQTSDLASMVRHADNPRVAGNLQDRFPHPYTEADAQSWIEHVRGQEQESHWAIACADRVIGGIGLELQQDVYRRSAELGYWLGEPFWGRGVATAAVRAITPMGFERFNLIRIYANVYEHNPASARVLEKAGFQLEGRLRRAVVKSGRIRDVFVYAVVIEEEAADRRADEGGR